MTGFVNACKFNWSEAFAISVNFPFLLMINIGLSMVYAWFLISSENTTSNDTIITSVPAPIEIPLDKKPISNVDEKKDDDLDFKVVHKNESKDEVAIAVDKF